VKELHCSCGFTNKISDRKARRQKGKTIKCGNCGATIKIAGVDGVLYPF